MAEDFIYSEGIEEIKPLTLNLTVHRRKDGSIEGELRKRFVINMDQPDFWVELFSHSLKGREIRAPVIIIFRDKFGSACKLKELGLLKKDFKLDNF